MSLPLMTDNNNQNPSIKVVLLGNTGVGKTSIVHRWTTGCWDPLIKPTIGANHQRKTVQLDKQDVEIYLWDTAGQERFHALTPLYARSSYCAIIMTSINDRGSFESINTWKELLQTSCERYPPCILSVNKIDLEDSIGADRNKIDQEYSDQFDCVMYVSALSGEGIDNLFIYAAQIGYDFFKKNTAKKKTMDIKETKKNGCC